VSIQQGCLERYAPPGLKEPCPMPAMRLTAKKEESGATPNSPFPAYRIFLSPVSRTEDVANRALPLAPAPSAGRDGGMAPAATAAQGRARWGALGCRIRRGSSEEEAETREETGAAGVKEV
jgi:hypothetical protein